MRLRLITLLVLVACPFVSRSQAGPDTLTSNYVTAVGNWLCGNEELAKRQLLAMPARPDSAERISAWTLLLDEYYFWPEEYKRYLELADSLHVATTYYNTAKLLIQQPSRQYLLRNDSLSVPIRLRNKAHPVAELQINGLRCRLIVDTGAQLTMLSRRFTERAKARKLTQLAVTNYNNKNVPGGLFIADSLVLDNLKIKNLPVVSASMPFRKIDGLLGWNILRQFVVKIDYVKHQLTLRRSIHTSNTAANLLGGSLPMALMYGPANNQLNVMLDTGANNKFSVSPTGLAKIGPYKTKRRLAFSAALGELIRIRTERFVKGVNVRFDETNHYFRKSAIFRTDVVIGQIVRDGLIGSKAFRRGVLTLDAPNHRFSYQADLNRSGK